MSLSRDNKPDEELYQACLNEDTATEHLAPHIASFVAPTPISWASLYTAHPGVLASEDDYPPGFYDSDSENEMYYDY